VVIAGDLRLIVGLTFLGVVIALCIWLLNRLFPQRTVFPSSSDGMAQHESPRETLQRRYARGEISEAEYDDLQELTKE
jgi:uncharacterized membrane protein